MESDLDNILDQVYAWSRGESWRGWNKHDGLNSPILNNTLGKLGRWPRMVAIQGVMRFPVNLRPWLLTPKVYNPKGLALFTLGLLDRYRTQPEELFLQEARELLELLKSIQSPGNWSGNCWGYHYPWQDPGFFAPTNTPNAVVTSFVCEAYIAAWEITGEDHYLDVVRSASRFFLNDLTLLKSTEDELCLGYMPVPMTMRVMDVSILVGTVLSQVASQDSDQEMAETAERLVRYVVNQQTAYAAWFYTDPAEDSAIRHDNYHTGFILDALGRYISRTGDQQWQPNYDRGLKFYADKLFNPDGAPRWMSDKDYPHDIHGSAQGILTFSRHLKDYPGLAERILQWSLEHMYHGDGRFYYQQRKYWTTKFTLLRWCNGWMARAMAALNWEKSKDIAKKQDLHDQTT